jgi:hypothetical protein
LHIVYWSFLLLSLSLLSLYFLPLLNPNIPIKIHSNPLKIHSKTFTVINPSRIGCFSSCKYQWRKCWVCLWHN